MFWWLYRSITIGIIVIFVFHIFFFSSLTRFRDLSLFWLSFIFKSVVCRSGKNDYSVESLFLLLTISRTGRLAQIRWYICISKYCRYYYTFRKFFSPTSDRCLLLESELQQISSCLRGSSQYLYRSQQCCSLKSLNSSSAFFSLNRWRVFQVPQLKFLSPLPHVPQLL